MLTMTWLARRASDGGWRVVSVLFNDPTAPIDEDRAIYAATAARAPRSARVPYAAHLAVPVTRAGAAP